MRSVNILCLGECLLTQLCIGKDRKQPSNFIKIFAIKNPANKFEYLFLNILLHQSLPSKPSMFRLQNHFLSERFDIRDNIKAFLASCSFKFSSSICFVKSTKNAKFHRYSKHQSVKLKTLLNDVSLRQYNILIKFHQFLQPSGSDAFNKSYNWL